MAPEPATPEPAPDETATPEPAPENPEALDQTDADASKGGDA